MKKNASQTEAETGHIHQDDHSHECNHHHHQISEDATGVRLLITLALNFIIPVVQVIGGIAAHSMALISDATHNFSDFAAILISYIALRIGKKGASLQNTFGYRRAEILAALLNVAILFGASAIIVYEAILRLRSPEVVSGGLVMVIAAVGVVGNGFSAWLLHRDSKDSVNVRGAFLHMMGDMLTSVAVLINGLILIYLPWNWLDPLLSLLIVAFILKNCWSILKESTTILMNATPENLDIREIQEFLAGQSGISGVHYLHAWRMGSTGVAFSAHVVVPDQPISQIQGLQSRIQDGLLNRFGIDHPVLQFETECCGTGTLFCEYSCAPRQTSPETNQPHDAHGKPANRDQKILKTTAVAARLILAGVFIYASYDKILHPAAFAEAVYNYQILPDNLVNIAALVLPWLELLLGLLLVAGMWLPGAVIGVNLLMVTFLSAIAFNLYRGLDIACGCFSTESTGAGISGREILRDSSFLILTLYLLWYYLGRKEYEKIPSTDSIQDNDQGKTDGRGSAFGD
jgi:cation diffusion facilitator family transporter